MNPAPSAPRTLEDSWLASGIAEASCSSAFASETCALSNNFWSGLASWPIFSGIIVVLFIVSLGQLLWQAIKEH